MIWLRLDHPPCLPLKRQTRRVIKPQPEHFHRDILNKSIDWNRLIPQLGDKEIKCPYPPGTRLWVKETWRNRWGMAYANYGTGEAYPIDDVREIQYKVGGNGFFLHGVNLCPDEATVKWQEWSKWRSPRFMPKEAARLWLEVKNVRVERLQNITADDIRAEGTPDTPHDSNCLIAERQSFIDFWDSINAKRGYPWRSNPWVWVYEFAREEKEDALMSQM